MREFMLIPEVIFIYDRRLKAEGLTQRKYAECLNLLYFISNCTKGFFQISVMHTRFSATYVHLWDTANNWTRLYWEAKDAFTSKSTVYSFKTSNRYNAKMMDYMMSWNSVSTLFIRNTVFLCAFLDLPLTLPQVGNRLSRKQQSNPSLPLGPVLF